VAGRFGAAMSPYTWERAALSSSRAPGGDCWAQGWPGGPPTKPSRSRPAVRRPTAPLPTTIGRCFRARSQVYPGPAVINGRHRCCAWPGQHPARGTPFRHLAQGVRRSKEEETCGGPPAIRSPRSSAEPRASREKRRSAGEFWRRRLVSSGAAHSGRAPRVGGLDRTRGRYADATLLSAGRAVSGLDQLLGRSSA
jgi:hypothetical protein